MKSTGPEIKAAKAPDQVVDERRVDGSGRDQRTEHEARQGRPDLDLGESTVPQFLLHGVCR